MLLTKLSVQHVGPFARPTEIQFEPEVTVLTGANDTGKTSVLNIIELLCGMKDGPRILQEHDVNDERLGKAQGIWSSDREITCEATFTGTAYSPKHVNKLQPGQELQIFCRLAPECRAIDSVKWKRNRNEEPQQGGIGVERFPTIIRLPHVDPIRSVVQLDAPNSAEREFLRAAFGPEFKFSKYADLTGGRFAHAISKARGDANSKLRAFLPAHLKMEFDFQVVDGDRKKLSIQLRDAKGAHTPLTFRGSGIQRLVSLMGALTASGLEEHHYIILVDEPEASLHADAQHMFRAVLEGIATKPNVQVVYTTHSPCMINPIRTASLRLLQRDNTGGVPTTIIDPRPIDKNFLSIRSSLGITPSDSLLYAPVTLIVEGPSEVIGLPLIFGRFHAANVTGFGEVDTLLSQIHLLDGCGDSFDVLCHWAASNGTRPVVFLDGDKAGSRLHKIQSRFPDVPIILLEGRREFEEIVPRAQYFQSLAEVMSEFHPAAKETLSIEKFEEWEGTANLATQMAFTKRVDRWVEDSLEMSIEKPLVMKHALQNVRLEDVDKECLLRLLAAIRVRVGECFGRIS